MAGSPTSAPAASAAAFASPSAAASAAASSGGSGGSGGIGSSKCGGAGGSSLGGAGGSSLGGASLGGNFRIEVELTTRDQVGALIGEGGKTISRIRSEANVTMKLDPSEDLRGAASPTCKVIITGTESCCLKARAMVQEVMRSDTAMARRDSSAGQYAADEKSSEAGSTLVRLTIARHLVGKVIGTRGATVKKLREMTGAVIEIDKDESGTGTITSQEHLPRYARHASRSPSSLPRICQSRCSRLSRVCSMRSSC